MPPDDVPRAGPGWLRADLRSAPPLVWAVVVVHLLLLLVQSTLQPPYRGLDEPAHVDMVVWLPNPLDWPAPGEKAIDDRLRATWDEAGHDRPPWARLARDEAPLPKDERTSFAEAGGTGLDRAQNQMVQHPPLYYVLAAAGRALVPGATSWPYDRQIALLRLLSALLVVPLPLLCWLTARRLRRGASAATAAACLPLVMPSVQRVGSSVSNDGLLVLLVGLATVLAVAVAGGDLRRRTAVALGLVTAAALLTKGLALALLPVVAGAYLAAAVRTRSWRPAVLPGLLAGALVGVLAGWWYVRNLVLHGAVQPHGYRGGVLPYDPSPGEGWAVWAPDYAEAMLFRFWSSLGLPEPPALPEGLSRGLTVALLVLALLALVVASGRRWLVAVALLPFAGLLALVSAGSWLSHLEYDRMVGVQGRYLYPGLAGLCAAAALALGRLAGPARRGLPLALLVGAVPLQLLAVRSELQTWWTPADDPTDLVDGVRTLATWSPWPDAVVLALWLAAPLAALVACGTAARWASPDAARGAPPDAARGAPSDAARGAPSDAAPYATACGTHDRSAGSAS